MLKPLDCTTHRSRPAKELVPAQCRFAVFQSFSLSSSQLTKKPLDVVYNHAAELGLVRVIEDLKTSKMSWG